jgi:hypothetical protein
MVDEVEITREVLGALNESTGIHARTTTTVYAGCARVQIRGAVAATSGTVALAGTVTTADTIEIHIPVCAVDPLPGDAVRIVRSRDGAATGRTLAISSVPTKTFATARRLLCQDTRS